MYDLVINAPNVRSGGGLILLESMISRFFNIKYQCLFIINQSLESKFESSENIHFHFVRQSMLDRIRNEFFLKEIASKTGLFLMFGNLPPLFNLSTNVVLYLQNAYIVNQESLSGFGWRQKLRIMIERYWFEVGKKNISRFMVQTQTMKSLLADKVQATVELNPFHEISVKCDDGVVIRRPEFLYPSSGEPHKNHRNLVKAWIILAKSNLFPELYLTLDEDRFPELIQWVKKQVRSYGLKIVNLGHMQCHEEMLCYIKNTECLIFPSWLESFGLPLIEAQHFKVPLLTPELDYVRDVVQPDETFDPKSPLSISRAVLRFLGRGATIDVLSADQFISDLLK